MWQPEQKAGEDEAADLLLRCTGVLKGFAALVCEINALAIKPFLSSQSFIETEICYKVQILWQGAMKDQDFLCIMLCKRAGGSTSWFLDLWRSITNAKTCSTTSGLVH